MGRDFIDYYAELGIDPGINQDGLKIAWREFVMKNHPDKGGDENTFKRGEAAYSILKSIHGRSNYDAEYRAYFNVADSAEAHRKERERTNKAWETRKDTADEDRTKREENERRTREQRANEERERAERATREQGARERAEREARIRAEEIFRNMGGFDNAWRDMRDAWARRKTEKESGRRQKDAEKEATKTEKDEEKEGRKREKESEKDAKKEAHLLAKESEMSPGRTNRLQVEGQRRSVGQIPTPSWGVENRTNLG